MMTVNFVDLMIIDTDTVSFLFTIFPGLAMDCRAGRDRGHSGHGADLAARSIPRPAQVGDRCTAVLPGRACGAGVAIPAGAIRDVCRRQLRFELRALRCRRDIRADDARADEFDASSPIGSNRPTTRPAIRPRNRRTSSWCSTRRASTSGWRPASRCRPATARISGRSTARSAASRRRLGRPELVHRIQRADRPVGAFVRPLRLFRHPDRRRPRRAWPAARRCAAAATSTYLALSGLGAFLSARSFQATTGVQRFSISTISAGATSSPISFYYDQPRG